MARAARACRDVAVSSAWRVAVGRARRARRGRGDARVCAGAAVRAGCGAVGLSVRPDTAAQTRVSICSCITKVACTLIQSGASIARSPGIQRTCSARTTGETPITSVAFTRGSRGASIARRPGKWRTCSAHATTRAVKTSVAFTLIQSGARTA